MPVKTITWAGTSLDDIRAFPENARSLAGQHLRMVQNGEEPPDWKPMLSIGLGVAEIRIHTGVEHRVFYIAKFREAIYVLHAFQKRTRKTAKADIDLARRRYAQLIRERKAQ
ncbi:type II toxin-antitoxin system RelE/ParE family toxin [Candidatus Poribacteria bacterium]|nr:type II toxin-antitoxin system RelE/ParE family toxin [Candidatus Poribacteria bacterium]